jgi:hypothetical protein
MPPKGTHASSRRAADAHASNVFAIEPLGIFPMRRLAME